MQQGKIIRWRLGVIAAIAMTLLAVFPQLYLCFQRGPQWNGNFAFFYTDEPAYAAYVNALIQGRPRRNDPYTGRDYGQDSSLPESLFSIQFIPAYLVALPARVLGLSTATTFMLLTPLVAFTVSLALFWLLALLTDDDRTAAALVPFVLCLGLLLFGNGVVRPFFNQKATLVFLPFLRRYLPAVAFPFFLIFFSLVWRVLTSLSPRRRLLYLLGAATAFLVCLYSYFFLWTAALAWLALIACLWLVARPDGWREGLRSIAILGALIFVASLPYLILVSRRAPTMDVVQALVRTHAPDFWRSFEAIALIIVLGLVVSMLKQRVSRNDPRILFTLAFALLPVVLFNQQIISGRSLQPMHYEQYVVPYTTLIALALAIVLLIRGRVEHKNIASILLLMIGLLAYGWGMGETLIATRRFAHVNRLRDEARPIALRLRELAASETIASDSPRVIFAPEVARADTLPMEAPQPVLWAPHMFVFSGVSVSENKERFFQFLYYSGVDGNAFERVYQDQGFTAYTIFGWERANPYLTLDYKPITASEIAAEAQSYATYVTNFDSQHARRPTLGYLVMSAESTVDLTNLDHWYERDAGERVGKYLLYRLTPQESVK